MKKTNALAFKLPLVLGLALTLGGCYTMLKHPTGDDLTMGHETDYRYSDCASCHYDGFDQPLFPDPYGYNTPWFLDYYGCPWWLPDCGYGYGHSPGGGYGGYAGGDGEVGPDDGRNIGGRGRVRNAPGLPGSLPSVAPPSGGPSSPSSSTPSSPSVRPNDSGTDNSTPPPGPAPGQTRTNKRSDDSSSSSSQSKDTGKKDERAKEKPKQQ